MDETTTPPAMRPADHEQRMTTARAVSAYQIGDPSWADMLVGAYLNPAGVPAEEMGR